MSSVTGENVEQLELNSQSQSVGESSLQKSQMNSNKMIINVVPTIGESESSEKKYKLLCGLFKVRSEYFNRFLTAKWALFWLCWAGALQGVVVNGFINVVITTIERRFGLRSTETGLVASSYDIASFLCLVPVTYFGGRPNASKPRWIAWGVVVLGIGSLTFSLPHFLVGHYRVSNNEDNVCPSPNSTISQACSPTGDGYATGDGIGESPENLSWNVWVFFIAQLLHGAGASPLFTLGVTYIDENVSKKMSSVYLGIYYTITIIGPAVGYVVGGQLLLFYTDMFSVDASSLGLTPESKVWVGAWWIGFILLAAIALVLAVPIMAYPASLPGSEKLQQVRVSEAYNGSSADASQSFSKFSEMPKAVLNLIKNPTFFFLNLAGASEGLIIAGFAAFLPKLIENQFSVTAVMSALVMGIITVPAGGGGTFLGGYLVKKWKLSCGDIIKLCLFATIFATMFTMCFFLTCPNLDFAGVTTNYDRREGVNAMSSKSVDEPLSLVNVCNQQCACSRSQYNPVCGVDGMMYYSPCHAGCTKEKSTVNSKIYFGCECIANNRTETTAGTNFDAINQMCETTCGNLWIFVGLCFFVMFFTLLATMPALSATLRCVHDDQRSFALGIQWIKVRLLGTIPAPIIFGRMIDETCILWQDTCDDHGACLVYDNKSMSQNMLILAMLGKACSIVFFFGAWWFYIPPKTSGGESGETQEFDKNETDGAAKRF